MKRKKVYLLYIPSQISGDHENLVFPNGLYYIYSNLLDNDIDTDLIMLFRDNVQDFLSIVEDNSIVGLSVNSTNVVDSLKVANDLKEFSDINEMDISVVVGGPLITLISDEELKKVLFVDVFFKGESEYSLVEFIKDYTKYREKPEIVSSDRIRKLDEMVIPAQKGILYSNIMTSRGCPGRCTFCCSKRLWNRRVYFRSSESVIQEMSLLYKGGVDYFVFSDDTFTMKKKRIRKIFQHPTIQEKKFIFDFRSRADYMDEELIKSLAVSGAVSVSLGIESADPYVLDTLRKDIDLEKAKRAAIFCKEYGIRTNLFFIVGCEGETDESIEKNIRFMRETRPDWITVYGLHLFPGTELYENSGRKVDWLSTHDTLFYQERDGVLKKKLRMLEEFEEIKDGYMQEKIEIKYPNLRSMFWKYDLLAGQTEDKKEKIELYKKSLNFYPSPEVMFKLSELIGDMELQRKAVEKFIFQKENDIRKDLSFLYNAAHCFRKCSLVEKYYETMDEIDFLEMNREG